MTRPAMSAAEVFEAVAIAQPTAKTRTKPTKVDERPKTCARLQERGVNAISASASACVSACPFAIVSGRRCVTQPCRCHGTLGSIDAHAGPIQLETLLEPNAAATVGVMVPVGQLASACARTDSLELVCPGQRCPAECEDHEPKTAPADPIDLIASIGHGREAQTVDEGDARIAEQETAPAVVAQPTFVR